MAGTKECALCGVVYANADQHQAWHDELDAWIQAIEQAVDSRIRERFRQRRSQD